MAFGRGQPAKRSPDVLVLDEPADHGAQPRMGDLARKKLEEAVELGRVSSQCRRKLGRIRLGRLDRANVQLEPVAKSLDSAQDAHGIAFAEAPVKQLDVRPDARLDSPARVDELECEVRRAAAGTPPLLACDG